MPITVNEGGVLYALDTVHANEGGVLYELNTVHANEGGVLYEIHSTGYKSQLKLVSSQHSINTYWSDDGKSVEFELDADSTSSRTSVWELTASQEITIGVTVSYATNEDCYISISGDNVSSLSPWSPSFGYPSTAKYSPSEGYTGRPSSGRVAISPGVCSIRATTRSDSSTIQSINFKITFP